MKYVDLKNFLTDNKISFTENEPMKKHTTFKTGGNADFWVMPKSTSEIKSICSFCKENSIPLTVFGKGSNVIVSDNGIEGVVLSTALLDNIELTDNTTVYCEAGAVLTNLCLFALKNKLSGLEFAYGIPGSVGGAVFMNAGAYGGEIKDSVISATVLTKDGEIKTITKNEMCLGYRTSIFKTDSSVVLSAKFALNKADPAEIKAKMEDFMQRRRLKQPLEFGSAGSTFKRPEGYFAGALIEEAHLKGFTIGDAQVSEKHAGFVINKGNAKSADILFLIKHIQKTVFEKSGVNLEPEVIFIGRI